MARRVHTDAVFDIRFPEHDTKHSSFQCPPTTIDLPHHNNIRVEDDDIPTIKVLQYVDPFEKVQLLDNNMDDYWSLMKAE